MRVTTINMAPTTISVSAEEPLSYVFLSEDVPAQHHAYQSRCLEQRQGSGDLEPAENNDRAELHQPGCDAEHQATPFARPSGSNPFIHISEPHGQRCDEGQA